MTIITEHFIDNFYELRDLCWSGALQTLDEIEEQGRMDEAIDLIEQVFYGETPTDTEVNDLVWFDLPDMMGLYDEDDDEEDEDDED